MKLQKIVLFALALLLLLALNFAAVYGCLYQFVFTFPLDGDPALLGEEYRGAKVLSVSERDPRILSGRYLLVRTAAGETRLQIPGGPPTDGGGRKAPARQGGPRLFCRPCPLFAGADRGGS